jgi:aconitate hydratase
LSDGAITIAAITSCTNTSNPSVMIGAGLVAKKAISRGLYVKPWVKTSLAPGSRVVTEYLKRSGLLQELEALRFHIVGYGCTSCIGNSGPLPLPIAEAVEKGNLVVASVLSGNRNFEARVHPQVKMNFLASPLLVVAYAIAGRIDVDMLTAPLGYDPNGEPVYLRDIWPTQDEINEAVAAAVKQEDFARIYKVIFDGDDQWRGLLAPSGKDYHWSNDSTYIREAPFFNGLPVNPAPLEDITAARVLLKLGDSVTTDHISPAGSFKPDTPAGKYLLDRGIDPRLFNSYGSRRGNHEVMIRGTFANVRIKNELSPKEGGFTTIIPSGVVLPIYDAAMQYAASKVPLIILAGKEYGSGSSRDWAAKGTNLLGVKAVIAESYERIHRSNLVGMGVLPLQYMEGETAASLGLSGTESFTISDIATGLTPNKILTVTATPAAGDPVVFKVKSKLNSAIEIEYFHHGGILQYVLRDFLAKA